MKHASIHPSLHETLDLMQGAYAPNTIRAVRADVAQWLEYCSAAKQSFATASPKTFATFVDQLAQNGQLRASTIRRVASSVACFYRLQGLPDITKSPLATLALRRMYRTLGRRMRQAKPIDAELLHRLLSACAGPSLMDLRNQVLLRIAHDTLLRRSELVSLRIEDLEIRSDETASRILLRRSKTDQSALGRWLPLSAVTVQVLKAYLEALSHARGLFEPAACSGPLLIALPIGRYHAASSMAGLSDSRVPRIIRGLAREAGLKPEEIKGLSGHSLRIGAAQALARAGEGLPLLLTRGGWTKPDTALRYIEQTPLEPHYGS